MQTLSLTSDQLLATTRSVRRRLDLGRPVPREVLEECLALAQQAPRASNVESRRFVVVTDPDRRAALAELWRRGYARYARRVSSSGSGNAGPRQQVVEARLDQLDVLLHLEDRAQGLPRQPLDDPPPVIRYPPGSWGPAEADAITAGQAGWHEPWVSE